MLTRSSMPLYHQLRALLLEKIEGGEWEPGHRLPGENELMAEFGVSRSTVRQAMQLLENQGLVERYPGRGTFVGRPKLTHDLQAMLNAFTMPTPVKVSLQHLEVTRPSRYVANLMDLSTRDEVYELRRVVAAGDEPLMLITSCLPVHLFPDLPSRPLADQRFQRILADYFSVEGLRQHKEVEIGILDEEEADLLKARPGAPALLLTYLNRLADGVPIEYRRMLVRGDRCKYYIDLEMPETLL